MYNLVYYQFHSTPPSPPSWQKKIRWQTQTILSVCQIQVFPPERGRIYTYSCRYLHSQGCFKSAMLEMAEERSIRKLSGSFARTVCVQRNCEQVRKACIIFLYDHSDCLFFFLVQERSQKLKKSYEFDAAVVSCFLNAVSFNQQLVLGSGDP